MANEPSIIEQAEAAAAVSDTFSRSGEKVSDTFSDAAPESPPAADAVDICPPPFAEPRPAKLFRRPAVGPDDFRYEVKCALPAVELPLVRSILRCHPAAFRTAYPPRRVNNVYFDTHAWSNLAENLGGLCDRAKLRLRWYGESFAFEQAVLEQKIKTAALGRKISRPIRAPIDLDAMSWRDVIDALRAADPGPLAHVLAHSRCPTVINHYWRQYLVSGDGLVRLTLDERIVSFDQTLSARPNVRRRAIGADVLIVEIKAAAEHHEQLKTVLSHLPMRPVAHSKYKAALLGMDHAI